MAVMMWAALIEGLPPLSAVFLPEIVRVCSGKHPQLRLGTKLKNRAGVNDGFLSAWAKTSINSGNTEKGKD
jgi:hypothetical protein